MLFAFFFVASLSVTYDYDDIKNQVSYNLDNDFHIIECFFHDIDDDPAIKFNDQGGWGSICHITKCTFSNIKQKLFSFGGLVLYDFSYLCFDEITASGEGAILSAKPKYIWPNEDKHEFHYLSASNIESAGPTFAISISETMERGLVFKNANFTSHHNTQSTPGVFKAENFTFNISYCAFVDCTSTNVIIYLKDNVNNPEFHHCNIVGCTERQSGIINVETKSAQIYEVAFYGNSALNGNLIYSSADYIYIGVIFCEGRFNVYVKPGMQISTNYDIIHANQKNLLYFYLFRNKRYMFNICFTKSYTLYYSI